MKKRTGFDEIEKLITLSINETTKAIVGSFVNYNYSLARSLSKVNPFITAGLIEFFSEKMNEWENKK